VHLAQGYPDLFALDFAEDCQIRFRRYAHVIELYRLFVRTHINRPSFFATFSAINLLENPEFYASEPPDFTEDWFDRVQRDVLNAQKIANERTRQPVNKETADSQRRIARVILDRVEAAKAIIASAQPRQIINRIIGKLVWLGGDACG
jgi:hypothetical protein